MSKLSFHEAKKLMDEGKRLVRDDHDWIKKNGFLEMSKNVLMSPHHIDSADLTKNDWKVVD